MGLGELDKPRMSPPQDRKQNISCGAWVTGQTQNVSTPRPYINYFPVWGIGLAQNFTTPRPFINYFPVVGELDKPSTVPPNAVYKLFPCGVGEPDKTRTFPRKTVYKVFPCGAGGWTSLKININQKNWTELMKFLTVAQCPFPV